MYLKTNEVREKLGKVEVKSKVEARGIVRKAMGKAKKIGRTGATTTYRYSPDAQVIER